MPDVDSEFEAVVAPRHNTIVRYVLWQVLLKTYPAATIYTDWRDYSNDENIALESNLNNHRPGCTISAAEQINPTRSRPMEIGSSTSTRCSTPTRSLGRFDLYGA